MHSTTNGTTASPIKGHGNNGEMDRDLELNTVPSAHLINDIVQTFGWQSMNVTVKDRITKSPLSILTDANGLVKAGELVAIMGPSGSGKTTLLNTLAHRAAAAGATTHGDILTNGQSIAWKQLRHLSAYVEQEDALIGSLTVYETMDFAARLALPPSISKKERIARVDDLLISFGMAGQAHTIVGTPIKKGLSGGQKKRLGVASRLVTDPKILFLDEPTSGLDSALSYEVINYIKAIGKRNNLIIIASIHQPSTTTFELFDRLCLLSKGKTCYFGPPMAARQYFDALGYQMPLEINPAEFLLDLINTEIVREGDDVKARIEHIHDAWDQSDEAKAIKGDIEDAIIHAKDPEKAGPNIIKMKFANQNALLVPLVLLHRAWIKSYRDVVAYGIRVAMYLGLGLLMGTVFLRLNNSQTDIQPYINAIFFGSAFMSFMAIAYVPAFLEDRATFAKERANGLCGPLAFTISNFLIGLPYLFFIAILFSIVVYFLSNFTSNFNTFMMWVMWLFLDLVAAEALIVLVSSIFPVFVVALAVAAFANGLWMCVDGFLVPMDTLNVFWKYVFHYIDYQSYVFQGMLVNEFEHRVFDCAGSEKTGYQCMYPSDLAPVGKIPGTAVLEAFNYKTGLENEWNRENVKGHLSQNRKLVLVVMPPG
ncbi:putative ATP-binding cassette transporter [Lepidopterella palustris CBS 459.81]|uniref:Putative ATP-binding cassette transporter n=1 Tax=Lepidopterella palustris CBS 459.81 TaxID=1314670 RepID=A0A8E2E767_9PEZI|nr:putative ATP-binding cassette transporter [Lepidopterella palustris CBS 459.81]